VIVRHRIMPHKKSPIGQAEGAPLFSTF